MKNRKEIKIYLKCNSIFNRSESLMESSKVLNRKEKKKKVFINSIKVYRRTLNDIYLSIYHSLEAYVNRESPWPSPSAQLPIYSQFQRSMLQRLNAKTIAQANTLRLSLASSFWSSFPPNDFRKTGSTFSQKGRKFCARVLWKKATKVSTYIYIYIYIE